MIKYGRRTYRVHNKRCNESSEHNPHIVRELPRAYQVSRQYTTTKVLGIGSSAKVFEAVLMGKKHKGRKVALKVVDRRDDRVCPSH